VRRGEEGHLVRRRPAISNQLSAAGSRIVAFARRVAGRAERPEAGRITRTHDQWGEILWLSDITPDRIKSVLREAAYGQPADQDELFNRMLETDPRLASVWRTRKLAMTSLDWELRPASGVGRDPRINPKQAEDVAAYCRELLADIAGFRAALKFLAEAIGRGTAVCEIEYDGQVPIAAWPVGASQLSTDSMDSTRLRVRTTDSGWVGLPVDGFPAGKFLCHTPDTIGGNRFRGGLLRACVLDYLCKHLGRRWWIIALELFGMPISVGKYGPSATAAEKSAMLEMIRDMGVNRGGIFPVGSEVELIEAMKGASSGGWPHERMVAHVNEEYAVEFLGATLTTQVGETGGAYAAARVHDQVREDLRDDDIANEGDTVREQLLVPLCVMEFGEAGRALAPYFSRVIEEATDRQATALLISTAVNDLGAQIPASVVSTELGLPLVEGTDETEALAGRAVSAGFGAMKALTAKDGGGRMKDECGCRLSAHSALTTIAKRGSAIGRLSAWIFAAVFASTAHSQNVIAAVQGMIEKRRDSQEALADLPEMIDALPVEDLAELQRQFILAGRLAGRYEARMKAEGGRMKARSRRGSSASSFSLQPSSLSAHADRIDFPSLPFVEAINMLRDRLRLTPEQFEGLDAQARSRAWRVAGVWNMQLLADIHNSLTASIERGETARDFRLALPQMGEQRGWTGENPWHASVVHYQNLAMSHAAGRLAEYTDYGVESWRYASVGDSCPICAPLVGKVFRMSDRRFYPPLHFWCDCEEEPVFEGEALPGEVGDSADVDNPALDAEQDRPSGFKWDPGQYANLEPVDLARFPVGFRAAFEDYARANDWEVVKG
jgi:phage gp29-like protein